MKTVDFGGNNPCGLCVDETSLPKSIAEGLKRIAATAPECFGSGKEAIRLEFVAEAGKDGSFGWERNGQGAIVIRFTRPSQAFRLVGILMGHVRSGIAPQQSHTEQTPLDSLGLMLDVSRNGVMRIDVLEGLLQRLALMGLNRVMVYAEDTYEVPGEPFFGYGRGGYSQADLKQIDDIGHLYGIEIVPCIQTLGHLEQVLKWPVYSHLSDTHKVILADDADANAFIEKMLAAASAPVRSKRIHIGMDEAFGVGSGRYRLRNGLKPPFEVLTSHLGTVTEMCVRMGLEPMIWSDMFFRLGSKEAGYYDKDSVITEETISHIPEAVDLVYWDYYHHDKAFYDEWIARHRQMGKDPIFAPGILSWNRFWANLPHSFSTLRAGMSSARENGLKEALLTAWGDDGMECDIFSILPGIQFFAELAYAQNAELAEQNVELHFRGSCNGSAAAWYGASRLDCLPAYGEASRVYSNSSKWMLWHDLLLGLHESLIPDEATPHYEALAASLAQLVAEAKDADARLDFPAAIADALALKVRLHKTLRPAYLEGNRQVVSQILNQDLPELQKRVRKLWKLHAARWHSLYRPQGWEVLDQRYGGLLARLETASGKLRAWLDGELPTIAELDVERHAMWDATKQMELRASINHRTATTPTLTFGS